ncbi:MAG: type I-E CRISPR-associated protein Cse1/CasA [Chitinispirillaceae bacterium]|nr:type I-E CRISPR-associated protein Cse1/CasA [Chitinispirillaceae bacterium]
MNLLTDPWVPVRKGTEFLQVRYKDLLCTDQPELNIALPRDDLELACVQLLAALTQVIFIPENQKQLRERVRTPVTESEFDAGIKKFNEKDKEWFDLEHPKWPFMQTRGVQGEWTSIQKLLTGMPEGTSKSGSAHAFFNTTSEIRYLGAGITAIALFNQASNSPSFGGGFKGSLRGAGPISTMVVGKSLRKTVWYNVLSHDSVKKLLPWYGSADEAEMPTWVAPIPKNAKIFPDSIGLCRGLFWQPSDVEMKASDTFTYCDFIASPEQPCYTGFRKERRNFELTSPWTHPYSPREYDKDGKFKYLAFRGAAPAWTQMNEYLYNSNIVDKGGYVPAAILENHLDSTVNLLVGGYKVERGAKIVYRRHDMFSLPSGWSEQFRDRITKIVHIGLETENLLTSKVLYPMIKGNKDKKIKGLGSSINTKASTMYYHLTETLIHEMLKETNLREYINNRSKFINDLSKICFDIFEQLTMPYAIKPELTGIIATARDKLRRLMNKLRQDYTVTGGAN